MKLLKKLFGGINLTWPKLIIFAIVAGVYTGLINQVPFLLDTSMRDIAIAYECWVLFGIIIIMNSKNALDSALKCFVFFLISQPLVYLTEVPFLGPGILDYYRLWIVPTILTFPMGFVGYFMKKDKWWGLLILSPILVLLGFHYSEYLNQTVFSFPRHLLSCVFCAASTILYAPIIFNKKSIRIAGAIIGCVIIISMTAVSLMRPTVYDTDVIVNNGSLNVSFDDSYKVYYNDKNLGDLSIEFRENGLDDYVINGKFKKAGSTEFTLEAPNGEKQVFKLDVKRDTYTVTRK